MPSAIRLLAFVVNGNMVVLFLAGSLLFVIWALVAVTVYGRDLAKKLEQLHSRMDGLADSLSNRMDRLTERR